MKRPILCVICAAAFLGCAPGFDPDLSGLDGTDDGSTGGATSDGTGTATATSDGSTDDTGSTSDGSTGETGSTGDTGTDGSTDTGEPDPLQIGDQCHPLNEELMDGQPCPNASSCAFQLWNEQEEYWDWTCEVSTGDAAFGETCTWGANDCGSGLGCYATSIFAGDCDGGYCCTEFCDALNDGCPANYHCEALSEMTNDFPPFFQETEIPLIGVCWAD